VVTLSKKWQTAAPLASRGELQRPGVDKTSPQMFRMRWRSVLGGSRAGEEGGWGESFRWPLWTGWRENKGRGPGLVRHVEWKGRRRWGGVGGPAGGRNWSDGR
jgi:hypothetical protein